MRQPLQESLENSGIRFSIPAPVGGWNARDSLTSMKDADAIYLDNWFPLAGSVVLRKGCEETATVTNAGKYLKSLLSYSAPSGTKFLFAADDTGIYDVTEGGDLDIDDVVSVATNGDWMGVMTSTPGGTFLWCCNGVDDSRYFTGSAWVELNGTSTPALTGVDSADIQTVTLFKHILFFTIKDSLSFYHLPADSVAGAASAYPLGTLCSRGGYLVASATWSSDAGDGIDDYLLFVTSEGEVVVFKGTDPTDAAAWSLVGVYFAGPPIGKRCFTKVGGDLGILTTLGLWPVSKIFSISTIDKRVSLTDKIERAFLDAVNLAESSPGWQVVVYPQLSMLLLNVPSDISDVDGVPISTQFVMNLATKAWCRFTGWQAMNFISHDGKLYFCAKSSVLQAWAGETDNGVSITTRSKTAFSDFKSTGGKKVSLVKPVLTLNNQLNVLMGIDVDYSDFVDHESSTTFGGLYASSLAKWDEAYWDEAYWPGIFTANQWKSVAHKIGSTISFNLRFAAKNVSVIWNAIEMIVEKSNSPF